MDRFDRFFELHRLLSAARHPVARQRIEQALECSPATVKRIIGAMRNQLNAPIAYDRQHDGYYYDRNAAEGGMFELPGLWFNASELHALLTMRELLRSMQPGLFEQQLAPIATQIDRLLSARHASAVNGDISQRVRILGMATRPAGEHFERIAGAVLQGRRLHICYHAAADDRITEREVSVQRLTHYRDAWYLDGYCHLRDDLRIFALDAIHAVQVLSTAATQVPGERLDAHYADAYGIFAGRATEVAVLRFDARRARWIAREQWHPAQRGSYLPDGRYELQVPYGNPTELILDILRYGAEVEVSAPAALRAEVAQRLRDAAARYD